MSGILECEGVFQVPLDDGWDVRGQPGRSYDISHAALDVGVNITVYPRAAVGDDIEAAVLKFASSAGASPTHLSVVQVPATDHHRAVVRFDSGGRTWLAAFAFIGASAILITSNSALGDATAFAAGEVVVASLGPLKKRGLFRR